MLNILSIREVFSAIQREAEMVTGLDAGSATIKVVVSRARRPGLLVGAGVSASAGIAGGEIYDEQATARSVSEALTRAAAVSRAKITKVRLGISGCNVRTLNAQARIAFKKKRKIQEKDLESLESLLKMNGEAQLPAGRRIIQIIPQEFCLGDLVTTRVPLGLATAFLECRAKLITVDRELVDQLTGLLSSLGIRVAQVVFNVLAAAGVALGEIEKQLGVVLLDLGSSTTALGIFKNGVLLDAETLPVGSAHITSDLAIGLGTSLSSAESLKRETGLAGVLIHQAAVKIIRARVEEIFALLKEKFIQNDFLPGGIVLTGGGALLKGLPEAAAEFFGVPVRVGIPRVNQFPAGIDPGPGWCVSVGLAAGVQN